ncbi:MAG: hypothetical protein AB8V05_04155 [Francisella endosymbiont of Hyalomma scupense]
MLTSNPEPTLLQRRPSNSTSSKIDISKIPLTPDITSAILAAETGKLCDNTKEFIYQVHKALFRYIAKEYLGKKL